MDPERNLYALPFHERLEAIYAFQRTLEQIRASEVTYACPDIECGSREQRPSRVDSEQRGSAMDLQGSVSHGTLRSSDLLSAFADELARVSSNSRDRNLVAEAHGLVCGAGEDGVNYGDAAERASELVNDLIDALNEHAPDGYYFGAIEGDGSDFGWWEAWE